MSPFIVENHISQLSIFGLITVIIFGYILYIVYFYYTNQLKAYEKNIFSPFACHSCSTLYSKWLEFSLLLNFLKGYSCSKCKEKNNFSEIILAITFIPLIIINFLFLNKIDFLFFSFLQIFLFSIMQIDFEMMIIHIKSIVLIILLGVIYKITNYNLAPFLFKDIVLGFVVGWSLIYSISYLYKLIRKEEGFGSGDKWLLGSLGVWFGYYDIIFIFFQSCIFATAFFLIFNLYNLNLTKKIPIGSFFCLTSISYFFIK